MPETVNLEKMSDEELDQYLEKLKKDEIQLHNQQMAIKILRHS